MRLSRELKPVPPDHPMFHGGVSFVFCHELPQDEAEDGGHLTGQAARFLARLQDVADADDELVVRLQIEPGDTHAGEAAAG
jgi:hypothetical protein